VKGNEHLEFDKDIRTGDTVAKHIGRISLGNEEFVLRIFLLPDGVHIGFSQEAERFVHTYSAAHIYGLGMFTKRDEGEGK